MTEVEASNLHAAGPNQPQLNDSTRPAPQARRSSCVIIQTGTEELFLLISPVQRAETVVIRIDLQTGALHFSGQIGRDCFQSEQEAIEKFSNVEGIYKGIRNQRAGFAILGYIVLANSVSLLLAESVVPTACLHGGHTIWTISETTWLTIPLSRSAPQSTMEQERVGWMKELVISGFYYCCETLDLTRPFPSSSDPQDGSPEFVSNRFLRRSFDDAGLSFCCPILLQGFAQEHIVNVDGGVVHMVFMTRRCCINVGSKYFACGLEESGMFCGNETEFEMVMYCKSETATESLKFSSLIWRSGPPPVFVQVGMPTMNSQSSTPLITVKRREDLARTDRYFFQLLQQFERQHIILIDLSRNQPGELEATETLFSAVEHARKHMALKLEYVNFDWETVYRCVGIVDCVNGLLSLLDGTEFSASVQGGRFTTGTILLTKHEEAFTSLSLQRCPSNEYAIISDLHPQRGLQRFVGLDSMITLADVAFFVNLSLLPHMLHAIGSGNNNAIAASSPSSTAAPSLRNMRAFSTTSMATKTGKRSAMPRAPASTLNSTASPSSSSATTAASSAIFLSSAFFAPPSSQSTVMPLAIPTNEQGQLGGLETFLGSQVLTAFADLMNLAAFHAELPYGPGLVDRLVLVTGGMNSEIHARYLSGRSRVPNVLIKNLQSSLFCSPRTSPLAAFEAMRQAAVDVFLGQRLSTHLPSVAMAIPHVAHNNNESNVTYPLVSSSSSGFLTFLLTQQTPQSPASTPSSIRFGIPILPTSTPALTAADTSLQTEFLSVRMKPVIRRVTAAPATILPLSWAADGAIMSLIKSSNKPQDRTNQTSSLLSTSSSPSSPIVAASDTIATATMAETITIKTIPKDQTKPITKKIFVPLHARSRSLIIPILPAPSASQQLLMESLSSPQLLSGPVNMVAPRQDSTSNQKHSLQRQPTAPVFTQHKPTSTGIPISTTRQSSLQRRLSASSIVPSLSGVAILSMAPENTHDEDGNLVAGKTKITSTAVSIDPLPLGQLANNLAPQMLSLRTEMSPILQRSSSSIGDKDSSAEDDVTIAAIDPTATEPTPPTLNQQILLEASWQFSPLLSQSINEMRLFDPHGVSSARIPVRSMTQEPVWTAPQGMSVVEMIICLSELCHLTSLVLTVRHQSTDETLPRAFDLSVGRYVEDMQVIFQEAVLPVVGDGTRMEYKLSKETPNIISTFADLYDYQKDEGIQSQPVRFVRLAFYGTVAGKRMTLGPIGLFGTPLPSDHIHSDEPKFAEEIVHRVRDHYNQRRIANLTTIFDCSRSFQKLFGDNIEGMSRTFSSQALELSATTLTPVAPVSTNFYDNSYSNTIAQEHGLQQYQDFIQVQLASQRPLSFIEALSLEECRMRRSISTSTRNRLLLNQGLRLDYFDPNRFIYPRDERLLIAAANLSLGKCSSRDCPAATRVSGQLQQCRYCFNTFCEDCMSPAEIKIVEYCWASPQSVCRRCYALIAKQESLIHEIRSLRTECARAYASSRRFEQETWCNLIDVAMAASLHQTPPQSVDVPMTIKGVPVHPARVVLAKAVPTDMLAAPAETVLARPGLFPRDVHWFVRSKTPITFTICLLPACAISALCLHVDSHGYNEKDVPSIDISIDDGRGQLSHVGTWNLAKELRSGQISSEEKLFFQFARPQIARLLLLTLTLPVEDTQNVGRDPMYHLGTIEVLESAPVIDEATSQFTSSQSNGSVDMPPPKSKNITRNYIKPLYVRHRQGRQICDIGVEKFRMNGFSFVCRHRDGRPLSQVKEVRVIVGMLSVRGDLVQENQLGVFLLPLVPANTTLAFDKVVDVRGDVVTLECLSNYGDREMCPLSNFQLY